MQDFEINKELELVKQIQKQRENEAEIKNLRSKANNVNGFIKLHGLKTQNITIKKDVEGKLYGRIDD